MNQIELPGRPPSTIPPYNVVALVMTPNGPGFTLIEGPIYAIDKCRERVVARALEAPDDVPVGMADSSNKPFLVCDAKGWSLRRLRRQDDEQWVAALFATGVDKGVIEAVQAQVEKYRV